MPGRGGAKGSRGQVGWTGATGATGVQVINGRVKRQAGCPGELPYITTLGMLNSKLYYHTLSFTFLLYLFVLFCT